MSPDRFLRVVVLVGAMCVPAVAGPSQPAASPDTSTFGDFVQRVNQYAKVRQSAPLLRNTKQRREIVDRRQALAQAIRESRPDAKQGDVFTPDIAKQFVSVIRSVLQGSNGQNARRTIRQGDPQANLHLMVNGAYPEHLPLTTVPPSLLRRLPELPERLAYRIVGHDFVLQDTEARLVIDYIPGALP